MPDITTDAIRHADPELDRLLAEEEAIERAVRPANPGPVTITLDEVFTAIPAQDYENNLIAQAERAIAERLNSQMVDAPLRGTPDDAVEGWLVDEPAPYNCGDPDCIDCGGVRWASASNNTAQEAQPQYWTHVDDTPAPEPVAEVGGYTFTNGNRYDNPRAYTSNLPEAARNAGVRAGQIDCYNPQFAQALRHAFDFFRSNANGRYSDRTLMAIHRLADRAASMTTEERYADPQMQNSIIIMVESPFAFDELTEEKTGGTHAMMVVLADDEDEKRAILAVRPAARRLGLGKMLVQALSQEASMYVVNTNTAAITLAIQCGWYPAEVSAEGVVRLRRMAPRRRDREGDTARQENPW